MTYNIKGHAAERDPDHVSALAEVINSGEPDVVCLQEVHCRTRRSRIDQADELSRLTGLAVAFGRSCSMDGGDYGNAVLARGDAVLADLIPLPGKGEPRSLMRADVTVRGTRLSVFVTHLSAWGRFRRRHRLAQIAAVATATAGSSLPHVLAGDLNVSPRSREIRTLISYGHLQPSDSMSDPTYPLTRQRLDYVFCDFHWNVLRSEILRRGPSDHWPLLVELGLE